MFFKELVNTKQLWILLLFLLILIISIIIYYYYNIKMFFKELRNTKQLWILLLFLLILIIIIIIYNYYNKKDEIEIDNDTKIIDSLEAGKLEDRIRVLLNFLDSKNEGQGVTTGIYYLKKMDNNKKLELYKNIKLKYIEKIIINLHPYDNEEIIKILKVLKVSDKDLLFKNLRDKDIFLNTKEDIIGNKLRELIELQDSDEKDKNNLEVQISILCYDKNKDLLIKELKKRNRFYKIINYLNDKNYKNISFCKDKILQ